ncbi:hypothetical protein [Streptomyces sp. CA-106131]|uniref:hypothetical protein n=1 Tax=Streptomyces sp. CA-106131 TaxID=3240045 RepID=UPI003D8C99F4
MADEKWNLNTTGDLTAESGSPVGLVNPPRSADQHATDRPAGYGDQVVPPKPIWFTDTQGNPHSHGTAEPYKVLLFWRSNVGERDADLNSNYYMGVAGLQSVGVTGHRITVNGIGDVHHPGGETSVTITGYTDRTDPAHPVWRLIEPDTDYTFTVAAHNQSYEYGLASDPVTMHTPALGYDQQHLTYAPKPPNDLDFAAPLPLVSSTVGGPIQLRWTKVPGATSYEVFDNPTTATNEGMDPARIGLSQHDVKLGDAPQPAAGTSTVTFITTNYTVPRQAFALKVRAVRTDINGTAYGAFSPTLRGHIPAAFHAPGKPGVPALSENPIVGGQVKLALTAPPIDATHGGPEWYAVYDAGSKVANVPAPLGAAPQATLHYATGQNYSFTVVAGNTAGTSPASDALADTVPA